MQIGIYSPRPPLLEQQREAVEEFVQTSCLDLDVHTFDKHAGLMAALTETPLDVLVYDTAQAEALEERVWEVMRTIPNCSLILLGDDTRHAVFGYAVKAADYLTTPLDPEDLIYTLARLMRARMEAKEQFLPIKLNGVWSRLNMGHITYLESAGHSLLFHMDDGKEFRMIASFRDYQPLLDLNRHFFRCHKSYVVNLKYVEQLEQNSFLLKNGESVNISRPYRQMTRSFYACYVTGRYEKERVAEVATVPEPARPAPGLREARRR